MIPAVVNCDESKFDKGETPDSKWNSNWDLKIEFKPPNLFTKKSLVQDYDYLELGFYQTEKVSLSLHSDFEDALKINSRK